MDILYHSSECTQHYTFYSSHTSGQILYSWKWVASDFLFSTPLSTASFEVFCLGLLHQHGCIPDVCLAVQSDIILFFFLEAKLLNTGYWCPLFYICVPWMGWESGIPPPPSFFSTCAINWICRARQNLYNVIKNICMHEQTQSRSQGK